MHPPPSIHWNLRWIVHPRETRRGTRGATSDRFRGGPSMRRFVPIVIACALPLACSSGSMDDVVDGGGPGDDSGSGADSSTSHDGGGDTKGSDVGKDGAATDSGSTTTDSGSKDTAPVDAGAPLTPGDPGPSDVKLAVRSDTAVHPISPLIYGTNGSSGIATNKQTIVRSGGNR